LFMDKDGPTLSLRDENGKDRAKLGLSNKFGPSLALSDANGTRLAELNAHDTSRLTLFAGSGAGSVHLTAIQDGGMVRVSSGDQERHAGAMLFSTGNSATVSVDVKDGILRRDAAKLAVYGGKTSLTISDEKGSSRAVLGVTRTEMPDGSSTTYPESSLVLFGTDGKVIWQAPR